MTSSRLPLYDMPGFLIRLTHQISVGLFHEECAETGLTSIQFAILTGIRWHPGIEQNQLSKLVGIDRTTTGNVVFRLEGRGLIRRTPHETDRRVKRLFITPEAEEILEDVLPLVRRVQDRILAPLTEEERAHFLGLLNKLVAGNPNGSRAPLEAATDARAD